MTTIRHGGRMSGGGLRNGHHSSGKGRSSSSSTSSGLLRCLILSLVCYSCFLTMMVINGRADTLSNDLGAGAKLTIGGNTNDGERQRMENTVKSLRLQVEELSKKADKATAAAAAVAIADGNGRVPLALAKPKFLRDETSTGGKRSWTRSDHTLSSFPVAGVNLALYGIDTNADAVAAATAASTSPPYELFDDFNIADQITGTESWSQLLNIRRKQRNLNLAFYLDKVALKRWLLSTDVPIPKLYYSRYESEIPDNDGFEGLGMPAGSVNEMIPREMSYVAKVSHLRQSNGVLLIRYVPPIDADAEEEGRIYIGRNDENFKEIDARDAKEVWWKAAKYIAKHFKERARDGLDNESNDESPWSQTQVPPGMIVEERITLWESDMRPAMQFQLFVIFGRVYIARWNRGRSPWGLVTRDGTVVKWIGMPDNHPELPDWVDWTRVVELAEKVGANKDMIRVDIFVGVSAENLEALDEYASEQVRNDAVKIVVSDCELAPSMLELEQDPAILEEAARLWVAGYMTGNYKVVPNSEIPDEYQKTGRLSEAAWTKTWIKTKHTLKEFTSMGVNLASYKMPPSELDDIGENEEPFELYDNFNLADMITGNENWWDLVAYRRELDSPGLNFYVDKVAQKRWLPTIGMPIPRPFVCRYLSEISEPDDNAGIPEEHITITTMLPQEANYAAKPSHTSCSDGVWLVKYEDGITKTSVAGHVMKEADDNSLVKIAASLEKHLHKDPRALESIALKTVAHGFVVEERFTSLDGGDEAAMEFKIFCFWGRVWVANWRCGSKRWGLLDRDGTVIDWAGKKQQHEALPDWVNWDRIIEIAEKMARHKDMFRVDLFVGIPASSPSLREDASEEDRKAAVEVVISEFEVHPTTRFVDPRLFEEAARLWIAGYKKLNIKEIPNDEVPQNFLETAEFPAPPESREWVTTKHTTTDFQVAGVNLGPYRIGMNDTTKNKKDDEVKPTEDPFELFEEFDISNKITGNEAWWDLVAIRIGLDNKPALPFYNDKVALRRYLPSIGIPMPKSFVLKYRMELTESGRKTDETRAITKMLPLDEDFVAKPSHACFGDDVWLVKHHKMKGNRKMVSVNGGVGRQQMRPSENFSRDRVQIGKALTKTLHLVPGTYGSWLYDNIKPGIVVEERFASIDDDNKPAVEFKVFTIWGKCYIAQWRRGVYSGIVYPDGSVVEWGKMSKRNSELPDWVDWTKVKKLAEKMGRNKDMFRTDIFVGVPAGSQALQEGATDEEKRKAVQVAVSEFELQPGTLQMDPGIFDDAARLWLAGYKIGNYKVVPNTQVPKKFVEKGYLSEDDLPKMESQ